MPTSRHEALRAAIIHAREVLAEHPDAETSAVLDALIAAAEPFANFSQAVGPPPRRVAALREDAEPGTVLPIAPRADEP
ncbi:hypothetical protein [Embleya scabrispora]|uniref:hypothetical protein n=1 Tax=Embleya scabrispora TaxID=159449 RepID=UPI000C79E55B|nr:hypothetical protein [Embleya scabrispora]